ncbi:type II secretion system F family protein [Rhodovulum sp. 12E13]|uniref:type II secretion system F family protein n=1 Tax=Rhodovulum sp. 12E13 TaxID=2203891 RepID=UPI0013144323|nr:type II secretion system F family protein [Rhodovulum sp. 12E13]
MLVISPDKDLQDTVRGALSASEFRITSKEESFTALNGSAGPLALRHDLVLFDTEDIGAEAETAIHTLSENRAPGSVLIGVARSDLPLTKVRELHRAGVDDILLRDTLDGELAVVLDEWRMRRDARLPAIWAGGPGEGKVIAVSKARGGVGASTLAVNLADALLDKRGFVKKVAQNRVASRTRSGPRACRAAFRRRAIARLKGDPGNRENHRDGLRFLKPSEKRGPLNRPPIVGDLPASLRAAGVRMPPGLFLAGCLAACTVAAVLGTQVYRPPVAVALSFAAFIALPLVLLRANERRRRARLLKQLPDALDLMARGLKVGHPLNVSLQSVADEMPDPIGTEFGIVVDQITYGDELPVAVRELADRIDEEDIRYMSIAIAMQHGTGGDLAEVLSTLSRVVRARMALRRKVKAISSEGRMTAYILSALPFMIAGFMMYAEPSYYLDVTDAPHFWPIMGGILAAVIANAVILFRLVNFRI